MSMYLGSKEVAVVITKNSMKAYLEAGGKCRENDAVSFEGCWQASDWENVTDMSYMFCDCSRLTSIPEMDTRNVTSMDRMFSGCSSLTSVSAMDTSNVRSMYSMFFGCSSLTSVPAMDTSNVTDMSYMFFNCSRLTSIPEMDTSNVTNMDSMFSSCSNLESIHMHRMKVSFDISASTKFTREALVEILNNLATATNSYTTLTMGSTNLAKLTDADKAIATGKRWRLA